MAKNGWPAFWIASLFLSGCLSSAQVPAAVTTTPLNQRSMGGVEGVVVSQKEGALLPGAIVRLRLVTIKFGTAPDPNESIAAATADSEGRYSIHEVPPGTYRVYADMPGYVRGYYGCRDGVLVNTCGKVEVTAGKLLTGVEVRLVTEGAISGVVWNADKTPLAGIKITALRSTFLDGRRQWLPVGSTQTNTDGEYSLKPIAPGKYILRAELSSPLRIAGANSQREADVESYRCTYHPDADSPRTAMQVSVSAGAELTGIGFILPKQKLVQVAGKVIWAGVAKPEKPLILALYAANWDLLDAVNPKLARVAANGSFQFDEVTPGEYLLEPARIRVDPSAYRHVAGNMRITVTKKGCQDIKFPLFEAPNITGIVRMLDDKALSANDHAVIAVPAISLMSAPIRRQQGAVPPPPGISDVASGNQPKVAGEGSPQQPSVVSSVPATVQPEHTEEVSSVLPVEHLYHSLSVRLKAVGHMPVNSPVASVNDTGEFRLEKIPADRYSVELQGIPVNAYLKDVQFNGASLTEQGIDLTAGSSGQLQIQLSRKPGAIRGVLQDETGKPLGRSLVSLLCVDTNRPGCELLAEMAGTDTTGHFEFQSLGPGHYLIVGWENIEPGLAQSPTFVRLFQRNDATATLKEGDSLQMKVTATTAMKTQAAEQTILDGEQLQ